MNANEITVELERTAVLELTCLRKLWMQRYGETPSLRSVSLLRQLMAWRVQAEVFGGLERPTRRALQRKGTGEAEGLHLGIGARLTRQWKGRQVEVIVAVDGFRWENHTYRSLSAAATAIAGSRWNGPRFFGLRAEQRKAAA